MSKVVMITDTHLGIKGGNEVFHANMELFYNNVFFPYLRENVNQIDGVLHGGDVFHDRRRIDTYSARRARQYFFEPMQEFLLESKKQMDIVCGNHDIFFRDSLDTNTLHEFIENNNFSSRRSAEKTFVVHTDVVDLDHNIAVIPWLTKNNRERFMQKIAQSKSRFALGHLELNGFNFSKVQTATHGEDPVNFSKFEKVFSGHYHYRHSKGNIYYLGSPTEQTWIDVDTKRGFHVLDTETGDVEFIENPFNIFENVKFGDEIDTTIDHPRFYRLYREEDAKQSDVDAFIKRLYENNAINVDVIVTKKSDVKDEVKNSTDTIESIEDTPEFIRNNVDDEEVASILVSLYNRALTESE